VGDGLRVVIIHDAPTFWNHVPMFEATLAIHSQRKIVCRSGLQVERGSGGGTEDQKALGGGFNPRQADTDRKHGPHPARQHGRTPDGRLILLENIGEGSGAGFPPPLNHTIKPQP